MSLDYIYKKLRAFLSKDARSFFYTNFIKFMDILGNIIDRAVEEANSLKGYEPSDLVLDRTSFVSGTVPPKVKSTEYLNSATGFIYACVQAIADEIGAINLKLYKMGKNGEITEENDSPILDTLYRANDFTTKFDLLSLSAQYLELTGEAPLFISYGQSVDGKGTVPRSIILLRPDRLEVIPSSTGGDFIDGYKYKVDATKTLLFEPHEIVLLRYPDTTNMFRGKGTLQACARTADIEIFSEEYNRKFFYNSAKPDSQITTDKKLTKSQRENLEKKVQRKYRGLNNAHKTLILENGLKWEPMGLTQKDMDFIKQQEFSRDKILSVFRVPKSVIGITEDVNRANAEASNYIFALRKIRPTMMRIVEQLNEFYVPLFEPNGNYFLDFDDPVPENKELKHKTYETGLKNGYYSINEVREMEGMEPIRKGGDTPRLPLNLVPINEQGTNTKGIHREIMQGVYRRMNRAKKYEKMVDDVKKKIKDQLEKKLIPIIGGKLKQKDELEKKAVMKDTTDDNIQKRKFEFEEVMRKIHKKYEQGMEKIVKAIFKKQMDAILKQLPKKAIDPSAYKFDPKQQAKLQVKLFMPLLSELVKDQSKEAYDLLGVDDTLTLDNPDVRKFLENNIYKFSFEMTKTTNKKLGKSLADGIKEGESIPQIRDRVRDLFVGMSKYRATRIARTEITKATSFAHNQVYKESGVVKQKEWLTAKDERTCQFCRPMDGKKVKLDDTFFSKGDSMKGDEGGKLDFNYDTIEHPPLHSNCRCTLIPVIK